MLSRDYRDIATGLILLAIGLGVAIYAWCALPFGRIERMGPGLFPAALGLVLTGFGAAILAPAFVRRGAPFAEVDWRPGLWVTVAIAAFAFAVDRFGMVPAAVLVVVLAHLSEERPRPLALVGMIVALPGMAFLIFRLGLGLPIPMARWPF